MGVIRRIVIIFDLSLQDGPDVPRGLGRIPRWLSGRIDVVGLVRGLSFLVGPGTVEHVIGWTFLGGTGSGSVKEEKDVSWEGEMGCSLSPYVAL